MKKLVTLSSSFCVVLCCVALQAPQQRTRPGRPEYGPVSGPDAGGAAAGNPSKFAAQKNGREKSLLKQEAENLRG